MKYENPSPKMAFTLDGEVIFFDDKNEPIEKPNMMEEGQLIELLNNNDNELRSVQTISVFSFGPGSNCKIVIKTKYGDFCFWVDCMTYEYRGQC